jgi:cytochrome P450
MSDDTARPPDINFFDPQTNNCPYDAYRELRDDAPVWLDPHTGMYVITRFDDVRMVVTDAERFSNSQRPVRVNTPEIIARGKKIGQMYRDKGWVPAPTLTSRDDPNHKEMRALFDHAFRPSRIKQLDPLVEKVATQLFDAFIDDGECDWVKAFAIPLPLIVIGLQVGVVEEDIWQIKAWTDAWVQRLGMMQTEEEALWSTEMEIEAQHYFQPIFERLRAEPNDSLLSDLVNTVIPQWGRTLTDEELHAEMMADTFVGGSETSTNALSGGILLLAKNPHAWDQLRSDPDKYVPIFVEEVVRLEGPVQGLFRVTTCDVELHGVTIPAGSTVNMRFASANRDDRHFENPDELDLDRSNNRTHIAFGAGTHFCLGAPLARRELAIGFRTFVDRIESFEMVDPNMKLEYQRNIALRALTSLPITFEPKRK